MIETAFWQNLDALLGEHRLVIDRPKHSEHPRHPGVIYPLDYGYLDGTSAADGDGIDVFVGSLPEPRLDAVICTVDRDKRDAELKLLVGCSAEDKRTALEFVNRGSMGGILVERAQRKDTP